MEIFKELNNLGYKQHLPMTAEELDTLSIDSVEFSIEANLVFDWFRDKYYKQISINPCTINGVAQWEFKIYLTTTTFCCYISGEEYVTYEEARLECLKKLIELCEKEIK